MVKEEEKKPLVDADDKTKDYRTFKSKGKKFRGNRSMRRGAKGVPTRGGNDFEFWNQYPELMSIATRFPWMHIAGTRLSGSGVNVALPNVAVQHYYSVPSKAGAATDPLNLTFRQIYLDMHRKYRGIGTYQASDIAVAIICIESVLQLLVECERIYGILKGYPIKSRIEPEGLLRAMGYSVNFINSVKSNMADFRYGINRLITLAKRLPMPSGMNFFRNHVALNAFTYKDSQDERADILVFVFDNYYRWQTVNDAGCVNNASTALSVPFNRASFANYLSLLTIIEAELNTLLTDSDVLRITSDFISCYGENNMQVLTDLPEDYAVVAQYSESILHKWHNSERAGNGNMNGNFKISYLAVSANTTRLATGDFVVYQENDVLISIPVLYSDSNASWQAVGGTPRLAFGTANDVPYDGAAASAGHLADSWEAEPSQEHICEAMLWRVCPYTLTTSGNVPFADELQYVSTEILTTLEIMQVVNSVVFGVESIESTIHANCSGSQDGLTHFDWHPYVFELDSAGDITQVFGDTDNVTVITEDVISKVIDAAALSAFKVTASGSGKSGDVA